MSIAQIAPSEFDWSASSGPAEEVRRILEAADAHDGVSNLNEQAVLRLKHRGLRDSELWTSPGGFLLRHGDDLDLVVDPSSRRQGIATSLARAALTPDRRVDAWSHGDHPGAAALAARFGIPRSRELLIMRRALSDLPEVEVPAEVRIRTFEPDDAAEVLAVNASAFAHHPEQGAMTMEDLQERMAEPWFDPAGLFLAVPASGSGLLGFHWTKVHAAEDPPYGEVYVVAVNPKAAGRGLGRLLTAVGLSHLRSLGLASVLLYVDGDNDPAVALYRGLGFEVERVEAQYRGLPEL